MNQKIYVEEERATNVTLVGAPKNHLPN